MPNPPQNSTVWNTALLANPHAVADKPTRVRRMFAAIAGSYDLNNRLHSLWMDQYWRKRAVAMADLKPGDVVLDVACGTGDLALRFARALKVGHASSLSQSGQGQVGSMSYQIIGLDFTFEMLPIARQKALAQASHSQISNLKSQILWLNADAMRLPLPDACVDVVSIAFGIRNVADPAKAISEFHRVLRPGGRVVILEFSLPRNAVLRGLYNFYFRKILPVTATLISGDKTGAYKYLPESVNTFTGREQMMEMMKAARFEAVKSEAMTGGVCVGYGGSKGEATKHE